MSANPYRASLTFAVVPLSGHTVTIIVIVSLFHSSIDDIY